MRFQLPKPLHGWREFVGEVGIIVLGILIALGAGQIAETIHEQKMAAEARENVRAEAAFNLSSIRGRLDVQGCIERRLDALSRILSAAGESDLQPQPSWIARPPTMPFFRGRWSAATASGRNSLFPSEEQERFSQLYELFGRYEDYQAKEQIVWAQLRALETWRGPLGGEARLSFANALQQAKYYAWDLNYAGTFAVQNGIAMGLLDSHPQKELAAICLPVTMKRSEALRRLKTKFGEP
jgi:type II secretory pathway pseudopilin PulG